MSARLHMFFTPSNFTKLNELVAVAGVVEQKFGVSHVCQLGAEFLLEKYKYKTFKPEEEAAIKEVPDPVNHGLQHVYLKQTNVNRLLEMVRVYDIEYHDFAVQHLVQLGVSWMYDAWKDGSMLPALFDRMKAVEPPKVVYHN
jgi:flagellar basal body rod protein FlgG